MHGFLFRGWQASRDRLHLICDLNFCGPAHPRVVRDREIEAIPFRNLGKGPRRLEFADLATCLEDLKVPPSNRLHKLLKDRAGQYSISVNDQWRICFRFLDGDAYDVEMTDYH